MTSAACNYDPDATLNDESCVYTDGICETCTETGGVEGHDIDGDDVDQKYFTDGYIYKEPAWNVMLRMALYERAYLNFFVPSGPADLAVFNPKCSYIAMNLFPEDSLVDIKEGSKKTGFDFGPKFKFSTKNQKLVYDTDSYDNIVSEFECYVNKS